MGVGLWAWRRRRVTANHGDVPIAAAARSASALGDPLRPWTALLLGLASIGLLVHGPIAQFEDYHAFADQSVWWGVPHAGDVLSNIAFAWVAVWGLLRLRVFRAAGNRAMPPGYVVFLIALCLTAIGSTVYHLAPDDQRLVWDRLPIALACAGLLAGVRADVDSRGSLTLLVLLSVVAAASVWWWWVTNRPGPGDLRPYLLLQTAPLVLVPLWQMQAQRPRAERRAFGLAIALYVLAKAAEVSDHALHASLQPISGHTLKHLLAAMAAVVIVRTRFECQSSSSLACLERHSP